MSYKYRMLKFKESKRSDGERASTFGASAPLGFGAPGSGLAFARLGLALSFRVKRPPRNPFRRFASDLQHVR